MNTLVTDIYTEGMDGDDTAEEPLPPPAEDATDATLIYPLSWVKAWLQRDAPTPTNEDPYAIRMDHRTPAQADAEGAVQATPPKE